MTELICYGNRIARLSIHPIFPAPLVRRAFAATILSLLLMRLPAAAADPRAESTPQQLPTKKPIPGTLVIVGGGGMPDAIREHFLELAGGSKGKLVVIPTASELADATRNYRSYAFWRSQGLSSVSMLNTLDREQANDPSFVKPLMEATAAWLGGGDQSRLAKAYRGTAVERELHRLLARGGVIGGTSAGASVMSSVMITGGQTQASVGEGFGLLPDVVIDQHFQNRNRQRRLLGVLENHPRCLGLGIDEQTAVVIQGHTFTVMGKANVSLCLPPSERDKESIKLLKSGDAGDLVELSKVVLTRLKATPAAKPSRSQVSRATMP
jgi:cyanophycinase